MRYEDLQTLTTGVQSLADLHGQAEGLADQLAGLVDGEPVIDLDGGTVTLTLEQLQQILKQDDCVFPGPPTGHSWECVSPSGPAPTGALEFVLSSDAAVVIPRPPAGSRLFLVPVGGV